MNRDRILIALSTGRSDYLEYWDDGSLYIRYVCSNGASGGFSLGELRYELLNDQSQGYTVTQSRKELDKHLMVKELLK